MKTKEGKLLTRSGGETLPYFVLQEGLLILINKTIKVNLKDPQGIAEAKSKYIKLEISPRFFVTLIKYKGELWLVKTGNQKKPPLGLLLSEWLIWEKREYLEIIGLKPEFRFGQFIS